MILQALKEYYDRKVADSESEIAPVGWERKEIPFIIVLDRRGNLIQIEDTREGERKNKRARTFIVPQAVKKTSGIKANLLWDVAGYVFGVDNRDKPDRALAQKRAFISRIEMDLSNVDEVKPILLFLKNITIERLELEEHWKEIIEKNPNLSFRFVDVQMPVCECRAVCEAISVNEHKVNKKGRCLITGEETEIVPLHASIKGVRDAQSSGANIISFNLDAFCSYNKKQGYNAPVGEYSAFAYTTALNTLLGKDSTQRVSVGDASTVYWSEKKTDFETDFTMFFSEPPKDDPDAGARKVKALFDSVKSGAYYDDDNNTIFYVLGLAPSAARIAVRFWQVGTISQLADKIRQHFEDLAIIKPSKEPKFYSLWRLLVNSAIQDKSKNIPPNIAGDFMRAVLTGAPYPATILQLVLRRINSDIDNRVKPSRAALIKAYLNRYYRMYPNKNHKEITMELDLKQPSIGYQLGRLFATLEKIQEEANPKLNATIRERFYGAACTSPVTVFANLMRLKNHHLAKIENKGRVVSFEKMLAAIVGNVDDFPAHLGLHEQGRFAVGYYHQRQDFFTKKEDNNSENKQ
jgi:CRISPR-associated protein Csd1